MKAANHDFVVLVIGDSLAAPREQVSFRDTWPFLLDRALSQQVFLVSLAKGGATTDALRSPSSLEYISPDFVIIHLGIVDCAPRLFRKRGAEASFMKRMPKVFLQGYIWFIKKIRKKSNKRSYVCPERFRGNILNYLERCSKHSVRTLFVKIGSVSDAYLENSPRFAASREKYNSYFDEMQGLYPDICDVIEPLPYDGVNAEKFLLEDGYHLNSLGADHFSKALAAKMSEFLPQMR